MTEEIKQQRQKFIEALFDPHEPIAFGKSDKDSNKPSLDRDAFINTPDAEKFCINPVWDWRNTDNINPMSLLFEVDEKGLTPKEQAKLFFKSELPFTTLVYSGGKSIHAILRFDKKFKDKKWNLAWWEAIARVLAKKGIIADPRAALITQLSRVPGTIREATGKQQTLITIRKRVTHSEILGWIRANSEDVIPPPPPKVYEPVQVNLEMSMQKKWEVANKWTVRKNGGQEFRIGNTSGNWCWLFDFGVNCHNIGLSRDAAIAISQVEWGMTTQGSGGNFPIGDAITEGYNWVQKQN